MTFNYTEIADLADELLQEFGQTITVTTRTAGSYNPSTGSSTVTETNETCTGALFDRDGPTAGEQNDDGSAVLSTDKRLLISPYTTSGAAITSPVADSTRVTVDSVVYTIKRVKVIEPAGTPVMYDCNVRR